MGKLFVCGDIHGHIDINKLFMKNFPQQKSLIQDDVMINVGDCGIVWYPETSRHHKQDLYWQNWLGERNYTFAFIDGNHENHDMLDQLPVEEKWGGKVGIIKTKNKNLYHLKRGEVYSINGKKFFVFGGAESHDKEHRKEFISWWRQEIPSYSDVQNALKNLDKHDWIIDFVLTHTCSLECIRKLNIKDSSDPTMKMLQMFIDDGLRFKKWLFGHFHEDFDFKVIDTGQITFRTYQCLYHKIQSLK